MILGKDSSGLPCATPDNARDCITADFYWHTIGTVRSDPTDGTLWVGSGDSHNDPVDPMTWRPYDENTFAGKIVHIDRNGRGLPNHPFCPSDTNLDHVCTKIYAKGFRNPFRFQLRPGKGPVVGDVGSSQQGGGRLHPARRQLRLAVLRGNDRPASRESEHAVHRRCTRRRDPAGGRLRRTGSTTMATAPRSPWARYTTARPTRRISGATCSSATTSKAGSSGSRSTRTTTSRP